MSAPLDPARGIAFSCDRAGKIRSIVRDDLGVTAGREVETLFQLVDPFSVEKTGNFLEALNRDGVSFGWDLNAKIEGRIVPITFNGGPAEDGFLIVGASTRTAAVKFTEALVAIHNEQTTALRSALKQISEQERGREDRGADLYEELSRVNNELVTLQRELARKNRDLEKLNRLKDTFLAMASHDLRKPISGILSAAGLIREGEPSEEQRELLDAIDEASRKVIRQLNDFLDVAQIEAGKLRVEKRPVQLFQLVSRRVGFHLRVAESKKISLLAEDSPDVSEIVADPDRLEQVLDNLVENALKYTVSGGMVTVRLMREADRAIIAVQDTGQGMNEEQVQKLFAPFQTVGSITTGGERSTGLGLAIVKAIVEQHGGSVNVESQVGRGTTFRVSLPTGPGER